MNLTFQHEYKSIRHLPIAELPDFTVITGANGAGKTHLLQAISQGTVHVEGIDVSKIRYYNWSSLASQDVPAVMPRKLEDERNETCQLIAIISNSYSETIINSIEKILRANGNNNHLTKEKIIQEIYFTNNALPDKLNDEQRTILHFVQTRRDDLFNYLNTAIDEVREISLEIGYDSKGEYYRNKINHRQAYVFRCIVMKNEKQFFDLTENYCFDNYPLIPQQQDPFTGVLAELFAGYIKLNQENALNEIYSRKDASIKYLSDLVFQEIYGLPPWEVMNQVLAEAELYFRFQQPSFDASKPLALHLVHTMADVEVKFSDLSSGERILISLAHFLFFSQDPRQPTAMPDLILLDEVDAPLHPSMIVALLNTIEKVMVGKYGRKVILATHSPSTVALAPEGAVHVLDVETKLLRKVTRDEAVQVLTVGVPTLSINLANRRQVFVESKNDERFYSKIATMAQAQLQPGVSLTFIASGHEEGGGCDRVKKLVSELTGAGNNSIYGIIDWDKKNTSTNNLRVLGEGVRYSIENYLLDPVLLGALLLREKLMSREELGLNGTETFVDLREFDNARLQTIVNGVLAAVGFVGNPVEDLVMVHYINGRSVQVPRSYLEERGHTLEDDYIKNKFPKLKGLFSKAADLKQTLLEKVLDDIPGLLPADFVSLLSSIQNSH